MHVSRNGKNLGAFNEEQLTDKLETGEITYDDLGWVQGMAEWLPLRQIVVPPAGSPPSPPPLSYSYKPLMPLNPASPSGRPAFPPPPTEPAAPLSKKHQIDENMKNPDVDISDTHESKKAIARYRHAYGVASGLDSIGSLSMGISALLFIGTVGFGILGPHSPFKWIIVLVSVVAAFAFFIIGTLISALGQGIKAQLDAAVHSSPFLSDGQKSIAMSL